MQNCSTGNKDDITSPECPQTLRAFDIQNTPVMKISSPMPIRMTPPRIFALPESCVPNFLPMHRPAMQRKKVTTE